MPAPSAFHDTLNIYRSYPEKNPFDIDPPVFNLIPVERDSSALDTPALLKAARDIARRTGINVFMQMSGRYPFCAVTRDLQMMKKDPGPLTGYQKPPPLQYVALPDEVEFGEQVNPTGNSPMFIARIGGDRRLLKIYAGADVERDEDDYADPTVLFEREKEAYAHLVHYGVCDKGVVPQCYGWTTLTATHLDAMASAAPNLTFAGSATLEDLREHAKQNIWPHALILEYFEGAEVLTTSNVSYDVAPQALRGLYMIHSAYVLQNDIRGRNILLLPDERVVWVDFDHAMCASNPKLTRFELFRELEKGWFHLYREMLPDKRIGL